MNQSLFEQRNLNTKQNKEGTTDNVERRVKFFSLRNLSKRISLKGSKRHSSCIRSHSPKTDSNSFLVSVSRLTGKFSEYRMGNTTSGEETYKTDTPLFNWSYMTSPETFGENEGREKSCDDPNENKKAVADESKTDISTAIVACQDPLNVLDSRIDGNRDNDMVAGLFSTRRPRDFGAGLSSGFKSVGKGVVVGAASLFMCPILGATQEGIGGFFKGVGAGVVAAITLPLAGSVVAGYQLGRGVVNTPCALLEKSKGRKWDKTKREWKDNYYSLEAEIVEVAELESLCNRLDAVSQKTDSCKTKTNSFDKTRTVVDRTYYDALEVDIDATQNEIRRKYYLLARHSHPDKNPDDTEAKEKFQKIGEAYQVLGDEGRRAQYDALGISATRSMTIIDSGLFFTMLFGSEAMECFIGKLRMTTFVEIADQQQSSKTPADDTFGLEQRRREVKLAVCLRDRLEGYVNNPLESSEWKEKSEQEAMKLCNGSFGAPIIEALGWVYENYATQYLGKLDSFWGFSGRYAKMQAQGRNVGNSWKTAGSAIRSAIAAKRIHQKCEKTKKKSAESSTDQSSKDTTQEPPGFSQADLEAALPQLLDTLLHVCLMDIEQTVRSASKKVLKDMGVDLTVRRRRAEALLWLGETFQACADKHKADTKCSVIDPMTQLEEAIIKASQKSDEMNTK